MPNDEPVTRREWFRLSKPQAPARPVADSMGNSPQGMRQVEHPINHDGMDLSELPPMREALLSEDDVRQLFADIAALGTEVLLMQRPTGTPRATASKATTAEQLDSARNSLLSGALPRLQIRYHWQQQNWIDTLHRRQAAFHLIRIAHDPRPPAR